MARHLGNFRVRPKVDELGVQTVEVRTTPVVIAQHLDWVLPQQAKRNDSGFEDALQAWRRSKSTGDMQRTLSFYTSDFSSFGKSLTAWTPTLKAEMEQSRGHELALKDLSILRWSDKADTMVVTFGEVAQGAMTGPVKRQYWIRQNNQWKIFFEGVVG